MDALVKWVEENGGTVGIKITHNTEGVRGTYAPRAMEEGEFLAVVPLELAFNLPESTSAGEMGIHLMRAMYDTASSHRPYWAALPSRAEVGLNYETFPEAYLELLESPHLMEAVRGYKDSTSYVWDETRETINAEISADVEVEDLRYITALVTTRYFGYNNQSYMIPIIDMANHDNRCPHWHQLTNCEEGNEEKKCFVWVAGKALAEGDEVCNTYGVLRNDESLLQYGFVLPDSPPSLCAIDYHDYSPDVKSHRGEDLPHFNGAADELQAEINRLTDLQGSLGEFDAEKAAAVAPAEGDEQGYMLSALSSFQQLRREAVSNELARLADELAAAGEEAAAEVQPEPEAAPEEGEVEAS